MAENNLIENGRLVYAKGHWLGARSGLMSLIAADAAVFALRNTSIEELVLSKFVMDFLTTTPFAAAQGLAFALYKATAFTAFGATGGITPVPTRKRVGDHALLAEYDAAIANAAALANLTFVADMDEPLAVLSTEIAVASATGINHGRAEWEPGNQIPLTLGTNEGVVVVVQNTMTGGGVGRLYVGADLHRA
jgi:hypothetical protein